MSRTPCTCPEHRDGAPVELGGHVFERASGEMEERGLHLRRWRYVCSCGSQGLWTFQSDNVPYHSWRRHVDRVERRLIEEVYR